MPAGETDGTIRAYRLLAEVMASSERVALGRFVLRTKEYLVAIRVRDGALALSTLRFHDEVRDPDGIDGNIRLWSTTSARLQKRLYGHRGRVGALSFSPDGKTLASSGADGQLRVWDLARGRTLRTIVGHTGAVNSVAFAPTGDRIASAGADGVVRLWANPALPTATH